MVQEGFSENIDLQSGYPIHLPGLYPAGGDGATADEMAPLYSFHPGAMMPGILCPAGVS
jgi:hypothetical protein